MAVETMLVDTLAAEVNFRLTGSQTVDSALDASIRRALDAALREFVSDTQPESFNTQGTVTLTAGTAAYDLPDGLNHILPDGVRFNASPFTSLIRLTRAQYDRYQFSSFTGQSNPTHYFTLGRSTSSSAARIQFFPTPGTSSVVIQINYIAFPNKIWDSVSGDGAVIDRRFPPNRWWDLVDGALKRFPNYIGSQVDYYKRSFEAAKRDQRDSASIAIGEGVRPDVLSGDSYDPTDRLFDGSAS